MVYFLLIVGLVLLFAGGEFLVKSSVSLALRLKISRLVVGMTIVSMATSAPELLVSIQSILSGHSDICFGNIIGSNIANIGLVLAVISLISPIAVSSQTLRVNYPMMLLASVIFFFVLHFFNVISWQVGLSFLIILSVFMFWLVKKSRNDNQNDNLDVVSSENDSLIKSLIYILSGAFGLYYGSGLFVDNAVIIAQDLGVSDRIISLSLVAIGTSIPELATSIIAAFKKQNSIALGNLLGSNIFNILAVLGLSSLVSDLTVFDVQLINKDLWWMLGFSLVIYPLIAINKEKKLTKTAGAILLAFYIIYIVLI